MKLDDIENRLRTPQTPFRLALIRPKTIRPTTGQEKQTFNVYYRMTERLSIWFMIKIR